MGKITDQDYTTACSNGDGTYSAYKAAQWLIEATTGKPLSDEEAKKLVDDAIARRKARDAAERAKNHG